MNTPVDYVSATTIRQKFNESAYALAIDRGELKSTKLHESHLRNPSAQGRAYCTWSEIIRYFDHEGNIAVEVHQYIRQGIISGRPDPKRLRERDRLLVVRRT